MKILLVSATKLELSPLLNKQKGISSAGGVQKIRLGKHSVDILVAGVGMTVTAFYLAKALSKKYDLAINTGIAGSFKKDIPLGSVLNVVSDCFSDLGAEDGGKFITIKEMEINQVIDYQSSGLNRKVLGALKNIQEVKGITVNTVHGNTASIRKIVKKINPDIESMEGAAFFFACAQFQIPCLQIRAVSNYVEKRNRKNWKLDLAIKNLNFYIENLLMKI
jgi:futalosine hydrolase